jgi:hypothetical protein
MNLSDLASLGSFVSGIAVLVSLVYLALQVRQATKHARAQIAQNRITRTVDANFRQTDGELSDIAGRGRMGDASLTQSEIARFMSFARAQFWNAEDNFMQHREGMLPKPMFLSFRGSMIGLMRGAGIQAAWELQRSVFDPDFVTFMDGVASDARAMGYTWTPANWSDLVAKYKAMGLSQEGVPPPSRPAGHSTSAK